MDLTIIQSSEFWKEHIDSLETLLISSPHWKSKKFNDNFHKSCPYLIYSFYNKFNPWFFKGYDILYKKYSAYFLLSIDIKELESLWQKYSTFFKLSNLKQNDSDIYLEIFFQKIQNSKDRNLIRYFFYISLLLLKPVKIRNEGDFLYVRYRYTNNKLSPKAHNCYLKTDNNYSHFNLFLISNLVIERWVKSIFLSSDIILKPDFLKSLKNYCSRNEISLEFFDTLYELSFQQNISLLIVSKAYEFEFPISNENFTVLRF